MESKSLVENVRYAIQGIDNYIKIVKFDSKITVDPIEHGIFNGQIYAFNYCKKILEIILEDK